MSFSVKGMTYLRSIESGQTFPICSSCFPLPGSPCIHSQANQYLDLLKCFSLNIHDIRCILPQQECEMIQLHPIQDFLCQEGQGLCQICSIRDQRVLYWPRALDCVRNVTIQSHIRNKSDPLNYGTKSVVLTKGARLG